jgi:hypothetical protein
MNIASRLPIAYPHLNTSNITIPTEFCLVDCCHNLSDFLQEGHEGYMFVFKP